MITKRKIVSKAIKRVTSRPKPFGISLSLGQLKQLAEVYKLAEYAGHAPDGFMFMTSRIQNCNGESQNSIEIIPYSNDFENTDPKLAPIKFFEKDNVVGHLKIKLKPAKTGAPKSYGAFLIIDNQREHCEPVFQPPHERCECCGPKTATPPTRELVRSN